MWPGQPMTAHWGIPDPATVEGTREEIERAYRDAFTILDRRISLLVALPMAASISWRSERKSTDRARMKGTSARRLWRNFVGPAFLVAAVVGSGDDGGAPVRWNVALAFLANTVATGTALVALLLAFGQISGAHLNPVVSLADAFEGGLTCGRETAYYVVAQTLGAITGTTVAHAMFGLPPLSLSHHARSGASSNFKRIHRDVRPGVRHLGIFAAAP